MKRSFVVSVVAMVALGLGLYAFGQSLDEARRIQATTLCVDRHNDTLQRVLIENVDLGNRLPQGTVDLPRLQEGGRRVPFFALWVPSYYHGSEAVRRTLDLRDAMQGVLDKYPDRTELATRARDIERIVGQKKIAAVLTIEGGHQIDDELAVLRMHRRMGIISMTLTHFRSNNWADSSTGTGGQRPHRVRQASRAGDESHRHDGRYLARFGQDLL
jgi:membrane dipeptidase